MDIMQIAVLAIVQGLTEFLPVSSSGHLVLLSALAPWPDQGLAFDVSVHVGSLVALLAYFYRDVITMAKAWWNSCIGRGHTLESRLAWGIALATIPGALAGFLLNHFVEAHLRAVVVVATTTIVFGLALAFADKTGAKVRSEQTLTIKDAFIIGCAQALALIPGTSRSGITMTAGLLLGLTREAAARFAFLLAIPVIFLAGTFEAFEVAKVGVTNGALKSFVLGVMISALSSFLTIHFFLKLITKISLMPFVWYRLLLGTGLFIYLFFS